MPADGQVSASSPEDKTLGRMILIQAAFLAASYSAGTWLTLEVTGASVTTPEVMAHGVISAGFVAMSGLVAMMALTQRRRSLFLVNFAVFVYLMAASVTGFTFLGDTSDPNRITLANVSMMTGIGLGMPATCYSLVQVWRRDDLQGSSLVPTMVYIALASLALTAVAGTFVAGLTYATAIAIHVGLGAFTVAALLGVLVVSLVEAADRSTSRNGQRVWLSLLGLGATSVAAGDGVVAVTSGGISYVVVMAEITILVYIFLMIAVAAPYTIASLRSRKESK